MDKTFDISSFPQNKDSSIWFGTTWGWENYKNCHLWVNHHF